MTTKLSEIISVLESGSRPKGGIKEGHEGIPSLGGEHLSKEGGFNFSKLKMISHDFFSKMKRGKIEIGDILIVKDGATTGKIAIVQEDFPFKEAAINEHLFRIRVDPDKAIQEYIFRYLQSPLGQLQILSSFRGAAIGGINTSFVDRVSLDLPPLDEQKRIAAILDKADEIKQSCATAKEVRDEIIRSTFLDMFGDLNINPKGWKLVLLNDLVDKLGDGIHGTPVYDENGDYFFINGTNLRDKKIKILENTKRVNELEYLKHKKDLNASTMFVSINGTVGNVAYYKGEPVMLGKSVCYFNVKESEVSKKYLYYLIQSNYFTNYARGSSTGSTIRNLSLKAMRNFPIPLPPIELQNKFTRYVSFIENTPNPIELVTSNSLSITQELLT